MHLVRVGFGALLLLVACPSPQNVNGTLRGNQRTLFEGVHWVDERCTEGAGAANCCDRNAAFCPDFADYMVADVRVLGQRIAVLFTVNNGYQLLLSDDGGESWRAVPLGSVGNIAEFRSMALHLDGDGVYLLVANVVPTSGGTALRVLPVKVDLATGQTTEESDGTWYLYSMTPAAVKDGTSFGLVIAPEDARGGPNCTFSLEAWKPGAPPVRSRAVFVDDCTEFPVLAADSATSFEVLQEYKGTSACLYQYNALSNSGSSTCVPWAVWPALSEPEVRTSWAGARAETLRAYTSNGQAFATTPGVTKPIPLGPGVPQRHRATSQRLRYAGFTLLGAVDGGTGSRLVRLNRDQTVDEVLLPGSPCEGNPETCFDPKNASVARGGYRDTLWVEPLGGDEFLVLYVHDLAPGINQYKPLFTASREQATYRRLVTVAPPDSPGPAGYPKATKAGPSGEACVRQRSCQGALAGDFYACLASVFYGGATTPNLEAAVREASAAACGDDAMHVGWLDCRARGGAPQVLDGGGGSSYVGCGMPVDVTGAACATCVGDVAITCDRPPQALPVNCASTGQVCRAGRCELSAGCTGASAWSCAGDLGTLCWQNNLKTARCDLFNMACDAAARPPAWNPCVSKQGDTASTNSPPRCEGKYLLWNVNGVQWADCEALGFSSCGGDRCVP